MRIPHKFALYEASVQSPETHVEWFVSVYKEINGSYARHLREDFCGTLQLSCEWVKRNKRNSAIGLDLDAETLAYGKRVNRAKLTASQKKRLEIMQQDVISVTRPPADIIVACNFSFFIFKQRKTLVRYFKSCRQSLKNKGIMILEMAGGPGMVEPIKERKTVTLESGQKFVYIWDQKSFDPIQRNAHYGISFRFPDGRQIKNAFQYDWRLWTIPEVRDALIEAGFKEAYVYWETSHQGENTGEYARSESGDNSYSWVAYVVGLRS